MARRGNGVGYGGPANGSGWGGPARGIGHNSGIAEPFTPGNHAADGPHSFHRSERTTQMLEGLFNLALTAESDLVRVWAATAYLDRTEGPVKPAKS